jgi:hypothetical protein
MGGDKSALVMLMMRREVMENVLVMQDSTGLLNANVTWEMIELLH